MTTMEILPVHQADGQLFHQPGSKRSSPSTSSLFLPGSPPPLSSSPKPPSFIAHAEHRESIPATSSPISTPNASPQTSTFDFSESSSFNSTPISSGLLLEDKLGADDDIAFPNYDSLNLSRRDSDYESSHRSVDEDHVPEISTTTDTTQSDSPLLTPTPADDTAIREEPSRHVDYLSHDWREEDIWASWRHIVSQRKVYGQKSRLENASWRTWAKSKYQLRTVAPERLNWLKESDVTWLYGPLKPAQSHPITSDTSTPPSRLSKNDSFVNKKPILKKRSVSEVMLQKSLSSSSLLKQAAASVQAQTKQSKAGLPRSHSDFIHPSSTAPSNPPSREELDYFSSRTSSVENETPSEGKERHIRFDEVVEQCVAVDCKEPMFDEDSEPEAEDEPTESALSESSSDEGLLMMKKKKPASRKNSASKGKISRSNSNSKMIETIPATTLKYRTDSPDVTEQAQQHHVFGQDWNLSNRLSPSPSQETLRPSRPSRNFLLADDDDEEDDGNSNTWSFGASNPQSSLGASANTEPSSSRRSHYGPTDGYEGLEGMRRTESGMFMPIDEDEDDMMAAGLFGRVSETVNTVKDIGWVIWNVGWRNRQGS